METKIQKEFIDVGFGFPVTLRNVPMIKVRGIWTPKINYNQLTDSVLIALSFKPGRLTGAEIKFIRLHFEMTLQAFAERFGVTHVAVLKWEKAKDQPTAMNWATEKDIRLFILSQQKVKATVFAKLYAELENMPSGKRSNINLDLEKLAA